MTRDRGALYTRGVLRSFVPSVSLAIACAGCSHEAREARTPEVDASMGEEVVVVPRTNEDGAVVQLETTIYRPPSPPPWPLAVFNHGSNGKLSSHHLQARERPAEIARFFRERGYLIAAPMRQGFGRSTGESHFRCDHADYALRYEGDIAAVITSLSERGLVKPDQVVVLGQSNGGLVTLGYAAVHPTAKGVINISGGVDTARPECDWRKGMLDAANKLGSRAAVPSLWLYAEDDKIFDPSIARPFFDAYRAAGARAAMVTYPRGGHGFALKKGSATTWGADVDRFLAEVGLPVQAP
jgi:pimeloyl-ACP methyl ester carboxylesterase